MAFSPKNIYFLSLKTKLFYSNLVYVWAKDGVSQGRMNHNNQFEIEAIDNSDYGIYTCNINNSVGLTQCVFNVSNLPYEPELIYSDVQQVLSRTAEDTDTYNYLLQWTQRLPRAVEPVIKYQ